VADYVQRSLLSTPDMVVTVPKEYDEKAKSLIALALDNPHGVISFFDENPDLHEANVYIDVGGIIATKGQPENARIRDIVYLEIVKYGNSRMKNSDDPEERQRAHRIQPELERLYNELDSAFRCR